MAAGPTFAGDCRCGRRVRRIFPQVTQFQESSNVKLRCAECRGTVHAERVSAESERRLAADGGGGR